MSPLPSINPAGKKKSARAEDTDADADDYTDSHADDYADGADSEYDGYNADYADSDNGDDWDDSEESAGESADPTALPPRVDRRKADPKKANKKSNGKPGKSDKEKKPAKVKGTGPRSRKAKFPTPGFNFFGLTINTIALFVAGFTLFDATEGFTSFSPLPLEPILLTVLGLLAIIVAMYASGIKPTAENRKTRKLLTALSLALGVVLIVAVGFLFLL